MPDLPAGAHPCVSCPQPAWDPGGWNERAAAPIWGQVERCGACQANQEDKR